MYAPTDVDESMWERFLSGIEDPTEGLSVKDFARIRVRREEETGNENTTTIGREIARGEVALVFHIFGRDFPVSTKYGSAKAGGYERKIPTDVLKTFFHDERIPEGWEPARKTTLLGTVKKAREIRLAMGEVRKESVKNGPV
jgi:hypothetical protein